MTVGKHTFRFADDRLQEELCNLLKPSDVTYDLLADGTVSYSSPGAIEFAVDEVVGRVFDQVAEDGYYRTEISDPILAERYRRFKFHTGTPYVEELRDGTPHLVQAIVEHIYNSRGVPTCISWILSSEALEPDQVSTELGITPTFACRRGEAFDRPNRRRPNAPVRPSQKGWWELCTVEHVASNDILQHLDWLFGMLAPVADRIASLAAHAGTKNYRVLQISIVDEFPPGGWSLPRAALERLGQLCDRVDVGTFEDDFPRS